ncbi:hypothetical protein [Geothermobacter hydrogeniphilus]|uniref:Uncharacterized protein n=1 Tax=Geothermobacter hydrogeniphilus TaxID=1969733 RepID=A0A1X0Y809_9BACT|nr:hypothetical protein [Geothermobacter hydrogeniphilus]ORJ61351.1 hypothetical protein B5V00_06880 [Geothermobacter hydrogeniphilus]
MKLMDHSNSSSSDKHSLNKKYQLPPHILVRNYLVVPVSDNRKITAIGIGSQGAIMASFLGEDARIEVYGIFNRESPCGKPSLSSPLSSFISSESSPSSLISSIINSNFIFLILGTDDDGIYDDMIRTISTIAVEHNAPIIGVYIPEYSSMMHYNCSGCPLFIPRDERVIRYRSCRIETDIDHTTTTDLLVQSSTFCLDYCDLMDWVQLGEIGYLGTGTAVGSDAGKTATDAALKHISTQGMLPEQAKLSLALLQGDSRLKSEDLDLVLATMMDWIPDYGYLMFGVDEKSSLGPEVRVWVLTIV